MSTDHPSNNDNNSLRAVSSSFSANDSLNHSTVVQQRQQQHKIGGGIGAKHSPGVVTASDSLESEFFFRQAVTWPGSYSL